MYRIDVFFESSLWIINSIDLSLSDFPRVLESINSIGGVGVAYDHPDRLLCAAFVLNNCPYLSFQDPHLEIRNFQ